jgi:hypothetical protein
MECVIDTSLWLYRAQVWTMLGPYLSRRNENTINKQD